jgi:LPXTG-motif cell wall-anchored protein
LAGPIGSAQTGDYDMFIFVYLMLAAMATGALVYRRER